MEFDYGDNVRIEVEGLSKEGKIIRNPDEDILLLKLENGYNIAVRKDSIKDLKVIKKSSDKTKYMATNRFTIVCLDEEDVKEDPEKKTIAILHCGGTVAAKVDYKTGGVTANFSPYELVELFPELKGLANIRSKLVRQMMSENMRFAHYNLIGTEIEKQVSEGVDGIIITHGTDTLHYTSAALAFMLKDIDIPVILVGSQKSSDRGSSDAHQNLTYAAKFIANTDFKGVAVCMHSSTNDDSCHILPATKCRKMHSSRRDAFRPINATPIAIVSTEGIRFYEGFERYASKGGKLSLKPFKEDIKIGFVKCHPNMFAEEISIYHDFDGLVIEGTGLGQIPNSKVDECTAESEKIISEVTKLAKKIPVVLSVQTINGRINMNVYKEGRINLNAGVLGNHSDMTPETTFIKLAWLVSNYPDRVKELITKNLRGEISECSGPENFLI